ncbi:-diketo-5-methylthio-1-phosphopentane phosphatase : 2,3-diketo-5-methylthio-1-phosphopentane phosphatase OS=Desulfovibrio fructosivorans JJ GN=DesfrDRAFT_3093 PE=4 SV=1: HAD [Gemmataceae bacterium]|nr:-diketo-5-methylthio-1-phosphopentane phosphatase : 2,3-diketo-5-methylthio-1-phosphopentane phosphatase OS=Desulfovibrio fructosivorans JJ GN=DesfrDRAFT_3093 PE=4 SV=1: HAD [Gemmataceae bacterium]VTU01938.1 -diketo-5-methylthio-1-phosphopentane phosphatase : 2,3-diketo-5-methylthio-1-phosphopentane phosphatase OS=Desulfovibrio fructosivorans JJ GN=DesfrDRAFT_3093 PE=4 SV=1: HAD [Gemmataceae bacterium]
MPAPKPGKVLVTDFDGTMTREDFYRLVVGEMLPPGTPDHWGEYRRGEITHFECLRRYFACIRATEAEVLAAVDRMGLDPGLPAAVAELNAAGWVVVVASAGCEWYIRKLLGAAGVDVEVHSNPGRFVEGQGLLLEMPTASPFLSQMLGVDKAMVVRWHLDAGRTVAFAGDGYPDADAARLVPADLRFARADLARVLDREGLPYRPFAAWSEVARDLLAKGAT